MGEGTSIERRPRRIEDGTRGGDKERRSTVSDFDAISGIDSTRDNSVSVY